MTLSERLTQMVTKLDNDLERKSNKTREVLRDFDFSRIPQSYFKLDDCTERSSTVWIYRDGWALIMREVYDQLGINYSNGGIVHNISPQLMARLREDGVICDYIESVEPAHEEFRVCLYVKNN